jgi:hypothetical protein
MYYYIKGKFHSVKILSDKILSEREEKFSEIFRQAEIKFLSLHKIESGYAETDNIEESLVNIEG